MNENSLWNGPVYPHGPLIEIAEDVWQVTGTSHTAVPRNMVVHRYASGKLWLHSVVALDEKEMARLLSWGEPTVMVVPNPIHRMDAAKYKARFPKLQVVCPAAVRAKVEQVVKVDATCEDALPPLGIRPLRAEGLKDFELIYLLTSKEGKVAVVTDCLMNLPKLPGLRGAILQLIGSTGFFGITGIGRLLLLKDRKAFALWLRTLSATPDLKAVCVAHGNCVDDRPAQRLQEAADRLHH